MKRALWSSTAIVTVAAAAAVLLGAQDPERPTDGTSGAQAVPGHLILLVEGDATGLQVTHVTRKSQPFSPARGGDGGWTVAVCREGGAELGRYPVDLSRFDLDPARVGQGPRVQGDVVWETRVAALVCVPAFADAAELVFRGPGQVESRVPRDAFARLMQRAVIR